MGKDAAVDLRVRSIIAAALRGALTEELALRAYALGREASSAVMLAASRHIAEQDRLLHRLSRPAHAQRRGRTRCLDKAKVATAMT